MHALETIVARNVAQIRKEVLEALAVGDLDRAARIMDANPDLYLPSCGRAS